MIGLTSEEEYEILKVHKNGTITLNTDCEESKCFKFDTKTGKCLNDNTYMDASRTLKIVPDNSIKIVPAKETKHIKNKCKYCGQRLRLGESIKSHYESCGGISDDEAERISPDDMFK